MRPIGAGVHLRGHRQPRLVGWMVLGSVPMAFLGAYLLHLLGDSQQPQQTNIEIALGAALLVGAAAMVLRYVLDRRSGQQRDAARSRRRAAAAADRRDRRCSAASSSA